MKAFIENGNIFVQDILIPKDVQTIDVPEGTTSEDLIIDNGVLRLKTESGKEADRKELEKREALQALAQSDAGMARVAEDIIDVLIEKQVIKKEDFLESVIKKIDERKALREKLK